MHCVWIVVTSLAEAEVEYEDKVSPSIYVRFPAVNAAEIEEKFNAVGKGHGKLSADDLDHYTLDYAV